MRQGNPVARVFTIVFVAQFLLLAAARTWFASGESVSQLFYLGLDYHFFYDAATHWLRHVNPYSVSDFTSPPASMLVPLALHWLPFEKAALVFRDINIILIAASVWALCRSLRLNTAESVDLFLVAGTFGAVHSLVTGGNMDGIMLALLVLAYAARRHSLRAIALGASFAIKVYTGLLAMVLIRRRQFALLALSIVAALVFTLPFYSTIPEAAHRLLGRTGTFRTNGNISPALLFMLALPSHPVTWKLLYAALWLGTLIPALRQDSTASSRHWLITYIPWMLAAPALVLRYVAVINIPVIARLIRISRERRLTTGEWLMVVGSIVLGLYPAVFVSILPLSPERYHQLFSLFDPLNALGVTILLIGTAVAAKTWTQPLPSETEA